jgi:hypothetical protein
MLLGISKALHIPIENSKSSEVYVIDLFTYNIITSNNTLNGWGQPKQICASLNLGDKFCWLEGLIVWLLES